MDPPRTPKNTGAHKNPSYVSPHTIKLLESSGSSHSKPKQSKVYDTNGARKLDFNELFEKKEKSNNIWWSTFKIIVILIIVASLIILFYNLYMIISDYLKRTQNNNERENIIRQLKRQKGRYNCGYSEHPFVNISYLEKEIGSVIERSQFNNVSFNDTDNTAEYIGDDIILPVLCSLNRSFLGFVNRNRTYLMSGILILVTMGYGRFKYRKYQKEKIIILEMSNECIEMLKDSRDSNFNEGFIAEDHLKVEVATNRIKRDLWPKVVERMYKDPRVFVTPRQVSGDTMTSWKWTSTINKR